MATLYLSHSLLRNQPLARSDRRDLMPNSPAASNSRSRRRQATATGGAAGGNNGKGGRIASKPTHSKPLVNRTGWEETVVGPDGARLKVKFGDVLGKLG